MNKYILKAKIKRVILEYIELPEEEIITQKEASEILGITVEGVRAAMDADRLPTIRLPGKSRRYTRRSAVEEAAKRK